MKNLFYFVLAVLFIQLANSTSTQAQACRPDTRMVETPPVGKKKCNTIPGDYFNRSICNVAPFRTYDPLKNEIFVPAGKTISCFSIVSSVGTPVWKIVDSATGTTIYTSGAPLGGLSFSGGRSGKLFKMDMDSGASTAGASVTLGYIIF